MSYSREKIEDRGMKFTEQHVLNTSTPCGACRFLRRRCALECPFFPYFSPGEPQKFAAIHKVFGASNVAKMLMEVPEVQRAEAANSLVYEANLRLQDPVYGCMGAIIVLQRQVQQLEMELRAAKEELFKHSYSQSSESVMPSPAFDGDSDAPWPQLPEFLPSSPIVMQSQWQNQNIKLE